MIYNIRGDKILVTKAIKEYVAEKLDRLNKYFDRPDEITANILVKVKGFEQTIEVTIPTPNFTIRNEESAEDLYAAIDLVSDKIERQINPFEYICSCVGICPTKITSGLSIGYKY